MAVLYYKPIHKQSHLLLITKVGENDVPESSLNSHSIVMRFNKDLINYKITTVVSTRCFSIISPGIMDLYELLCYLEWLNCGTMSDVRNCYCDV